MLDGGETPLQVIIQDVNNKNKSSEYYGRHGFTE